MKSLKVSGSLLFLFGLALLLLLYFNFAYRPLDEKLQALNSEHMVDEAKIAEYNQNLAQIDSLRSTAASMEEQLAKAQKNMNVNAGATAEDLNRGMQQMEITPETLRVGSETVSPANIRSSSGWLLCSIEINLGFSSTKEQLAKLLQYFENESNGSYFINNLNYSVVEESGLLKTNLTMTLYYFSETAKAAAVSSGAGSAAP